MAFRRLLLPLCILLLLSGCGTKPSDFHGEISDTVIVAMAPGETDPSDGLTAVIHNRSNREFAYGRAFLLEVQKEDGWYRLPYTSGAFPEDGLIIPAGRQVTHRFPLDSHFAPLKAGTYRVLLEGTLYREDGTGEKQHLALVFTVAKDGSLLP